MNQAREVRFGIVGCGMISGFHARAIRELEGACVVAAVSRTLEKARAFCGEWGGSPAGSLEEMVGRPDVDAVVIGTPSGQHAAQGIVAAGAGKHVVVEKPIDVTVAKADALIAACREAGVRLAVISQNRYLDVVTGARRAVAQGRFGRLTLGGAYVKWFRPQSYYDSGAWRGTWALDGGGCLINQGIHAIDLLLHLFGPVVRVQALAATLAHDIEVEDTAAAVLTFAHGGIGHVVGSTAAAPGQAATVEIHGEKGSVQFELGGRVNLWKFAEEGSGEESAAPGASAIGVGGASDPKAINVEYHRRQFADVVVAIREGREPGVNGAEGRRALALIEAIYRSAREGREVEVA